MWDGSSCLNINSTPLNSCIHGYDFENSDKDPSPGPNVNSGAESDSHGTHIAGIISAQANNATGVLGVSPFHTKIMSLKTNLTSAQIANAINFAKANGAKVINASWGIGFDSTDCNVALDTAVYNAISTFNGLFVSSAGNSTKNHNLSTFFDYPADYSKTTGCWSALSNMIVVAATDQNDALTSFSDYGIGVDIAAPGKNILSTVGDAPNYSLGEEFSGVSNGNVPAGFTKSSNSSVYWGVYNNTLYSDYANVAYNDSVATTNTLTSPTYNLSGLQEVQFAFLVSCETEYASPASADRLYVDYTGNNWVEGGHISSINEYTLDALAGDANPNNTPPAYLLTYQIPLSYKTSTFQFRFTWSTDGDGNNGTFGGGCIIGGMYLRSYGNGSTNQYGYMDGTSMASPYVTGAAAYLLSVDNTLTPVQIKNLLIYSTDKISGNVNALSYGQSGRLNLFNAVKSPLLMADLASNNKYFGDFNGDGLTDIMVATTQDNNDGVGGNNDLAWYFFKNNGSTIKLESMWNSSYGISAASDKYYVSDLNGDGKDDILISTTRVNGNGTIGDNDLAWYLMRSGGNTFQDGGQLNSSYGLDSDKYYVSDFNGDNKDDILISTIRVNGNGTIGDNDLAWYLMRSNGSYFQDGGQLSSSYGLDSDKYYIADLNGDGKKDVVISTTRINGDGVGGNNDLAWYLMRSNGSYFQDGGQQNNSYGLDVDSYFVSDFNGDGKDDMVISTSRVNGDGIGGNNDLAWYLMRSNGVNYQDGGLINNSFGLLGDIPVIVKHNNDAMSDILLGIKRVNTIFTNSIYDWYIMISNGTGVSLGGKVG